MLPPPPSSLIHCRYRQVCECAHKKKTLSARLLPVPTAVGLTVKEELRGREREGRVEPERKGGREGMCQ